MNTITLRSSSLIVAVALSSLAGCAASRSYQGSGSAPTATSTAPASYSGRGNAGVVVSSSVEASDSPSGPSADSAQAEAPAVYRSPSPGASPAASAPPPPPPAQPTSPGSVTGGGVAGRMTMGEATAPARPRAVDVSPTIRPGLSTEWGENRGSAVRYTSFERASTQPDDIATIHYNDSRLAAMQADHHAAHAPARWFGLHHDGVHVSIRGEHGEVLPGIPSGERMYVLGQSGQRYSILVENTTPARFEAVVSVDGLDVVNGRPANTGFRGYILPPYGSVTIDGWRRDQNTVAAFRFGSVADGYAAQTGSARNVGVIGVALFAERGAVVDLERNEVEIREQANPFPGQYAAPPPRRHYE